MHKLNEKQFYACLWIVGGCESVQKEKVGDLGLWILLRNPREIQFFAEKTPVF